MDQIGKLNRRLKTRLKGRLIIDDRSKKPDLTDDEVFLIESVVKSKSQLYGLPTIVPISRLHHLDFIGWDNEDYKDVLLCSSSK